MTGIVLIHWKAEETPERLERLRAAGHRAEAWDPRVPGAMARYRQRPPAAIVIDLTRLPSHGRAIASALRQQKSYRHVPLIFAGGAQEKVAAIREAIPDAVYTSWEEIGGAVRRAATLPVTEPVVPPSDVARPDTPLTVKLGIERESMVRLLSAPEGFERLLEPLPAGASLRRSARGKADVTLLVVRSRTELDDAQPVIAAAIEAGSRLWIIWPKKSSGVRSDLTAPGIRERLQREQLTDYKICSLDATWSGMLFARARSQATSASLE